MHCVPQQLRESLTVEATGVASQMLREQREEAELFVEMDFLMQERVHALSCELESYAYCWFY